MYTSIMLPNHYQMSLSNVQTAQERNPGLRNCQVCFALLVKMFLNDFVSKSFMQYKDLLKAMGKNVLLRPIWAHYL